jgi:hypothetical protein
VQPHVRALERGYFGALGVRTRGPEINRLLCFFRTYYLPFLSSHPRYNTHVLCIDPLGTITPELLKDLRSDIVSLSLLVHPTEVCRFFLRFAHPHRLPVHSPVASVPQVHPNMHMGCFT